MPNVEEPMDPIDPSPHEPSSSKRRPSWLRETLEEVSTGKKLNVSHFRIFGSHVYFHVSKKSEINWRHLGRKELLWATRKLLRHIESMCLVKEK